MAISAVLCAVGEFMNTFAFRAAGLPYRWYRALDAFRKTMVVCLMVMGDPIAALLLPPVIVGGVALMLPSSESIDRLWEAFRMGRVIEENDNAGVEDAGTIRTRMDTLWSFRASAGHDADDDDDDDGDADADEVPLMIHAT